MRFSILVLLVVAGLSWSAAGQNLLTNPGAETGTFEGWERGGNHPGQPMINPSTHLAVPVNHSGQYRFGISIGYVAASVYQYQTVSVTPGHTYGVSLWAVKMDGTEERLLVTWINGPFPGVERDLYELTWSQQVPNWTHLNGATFVPTSNQATIVLRYEHSIPSGIASVHVDDMALIDLSPTHTPSPTPTGTYTHTPTVTPGADLDGDGLADPVEGWPPFPVQSNRLLADSDGDGLSDGAEDANRSGGREPAETSTRRRDTDGDGASDGFEVRQLGTDPLERSVPAAWVDQDADGLPVPYDVQDNDTDSDNDRFMDGYEVDALGLGAERQGNLRPTLGDLNRDGLVTNVDALLAQTLFLDLIPPVSPAFGDKGFSNGDPNLDGNISNVDALLLQAFFLWLVEELPVHPATPTPLPSETPTRTNTPSISPTPTVTPTGYTPQPIALQNGNFESAFISGVAAGWTKFQLSNDGFHKASERLGRLGGGLFGCYGPSGVPGYDCLDEYQSIRMSAKTYSIDISRYDLIGKFHNVLGQEALLVVRINAEGAGIYPDGDTWERNAYEDGRRLADHYKNYWIRNNPGFEADAVYGLNEPSVNVLTDLAKVALFELGFTRRLHELGYRSCVMNNAVGTPGDNNNFLLEEVRQLFAEADFIGYHPYGNWNTGWMCPADAGPWTYRWQEISRMYRDRGWRHPALLYTEGGQYWWVGRKTPAQIISDLVCYERRERTEEFWSVGLHYFVTGAWPGGWDEMHLGLFPEIIDACRATNQANPVDAHSGLFSQEMGARKAAFDLGIVQQVQTRPGRRVEFAGWFKYEFEEGWPHRATIRVGWDPTGQTGDALAPTIEWTNDLIAEGPNNRIHQGPWDSDIWYEYRREFLTAGTSASLWIRVKQMTSTPSVRVYVDDVSLREL